MNNIVIFTNSYDVNGLIKNDLTPLDILEKTKNKNFDLTGFADWKNVMYTDKPNAFLFQNIFDSQIENMDKGVSSFKWDRELFDFNPFFFEKKDTTSENILVSVNETKIDNDSNTLIYFAYFLKAVEEHLRSGRIQEATDMVISEIDEKIEGREYSAIDNLLNRIYTMVADLTVMLAVLTVTKHIKQFLLNRGYILDTAEKLIQNKYGPDKIEVLLKNRR